MFRKLNLVLTSCHLAASDGVGMYYVELVLEQGTYRQTQGEGFFGKQTLNPNDIDGLGILPDDTKGHHLPPKAVD